ncbi:MAG: DUF4112 domain-containing protein [Gemmatimonadetes bacterium]|nr:DUF4112 domain-containing protein [Gemmatimonadota bacterium]
MSPTSLDRLRRFAYWLDSGIPVPGTGFRFGLDPIIGLIAVWATRRERSSRAGLSSKLLTRLPNQARTFTLDNCTRAVIYRTRTAIYCTRSAYNYTLPIL